MTSDDPQCKVCSTRFSKHGDKNHPFDKFEPIKREDQHAARDVEVKASSLPFDPVLRQALVDKGIITPNDLHAAEAKIRDVSMTIFGRGDA